MPQQKFYLDAAKTQDVTVKWRGIWKDVTVSHNDVVLGEPFPNLAALKQGRAFTLPDGRTLQVRFAAGFAKNRLELDLDGRPVAGSGGDATVELKLAASVTWFIAGMSMLFGILGMAGVEFFVAMGFGWPALLAGMAFGVLAYFVGKKSLLALWLTVGLFAIDTVLTIFVTMEASRPPTMAIVIRVFLFLALIRGFGAIKKLKEDERLANAAQTF